MTQCYRHLQVMFAHRITDAPIRNRVICIRRLNIFHNYTRSRRMSLSHESRMNLIWISLRRFRIRLSEGRWPSRTLICGLGNGVRILTEFPYRRYSISLRRIRSSRSDVSLVREKKRERKSENAERLNSINSIILRKRLAHDNGANESFPPSTININTATMCELSPSVSLNLFLALVCSYVRNGRAPMFTDTFVTRVTSVCRVLETSVSACISIVRVSIIVAELARSITSAREKSGCFRPRDDSKATEINDVSGIERRRLSFGHPVYLDNSC